MKAQNRTSLPLLLTALFIALLAAGCSEAPLTPQGNNPPGSEPSTSSGAFAPVAVTVSGIGSQQISASAHAVNRQPAVISGSSASTPPPVASTSPGTNVAQADIPMTFVSSGSFTYGPRGNGGMRYLYATFNVHNATGQALSNLTFLAVATGATIGHTAVSKLTLFNPNKHLSGPDAETIAKAMIPTSRTVRTPAGAIGSTIPDVLQVFTESEAQAFEDNLPSGTSVTDVFPYGFVVRSPDAPDGRTLAAGQDGQITFAFKLPLEANGQNDPFEITMMFQPVQDSQTHITESLQEQNSQDAAAFAKRAGILDNATAILLPGAIYRGAAPIRRVCGPVRVAGPESNPAAQTLLFDPSAVPELQSLSPNPYATGGSAGHISATSAFSATYDHPLRAANARNFVVNGSQSGPQFLNGGYTGGGTTTISTPNGSFFPGEQVSVTLTTALGSCKPTVAGYRVAVAGGTGAFSPAPGSPVSLGLHPSSVTAGDWDGDGKLDLAVANANFSGTVSILTGNGDGTFTKDADVSVGRYPKSVAAGDWDGDGDLDLAVANGGSHSVSILKNDGSGTFTRVADVSVGSQLFMMAAGDWDGDGDLDLAVTMFGGTVGILMNDGHGTFTKDADVSAGNFPISMTAGDWDGDGDMDLAVVGGGFSGTVSILTGNGDGTFTAAQTVTVGHRPVSVAAGDWDGDGDIDLAVANSSSNNVSILKNNGGGTFNVAQTVSVGSQQASVAAGDWDGDGDLDLVVANGSSDAVSILKNNGHGTFTFTKAANVSVGDSPSSVAMGDWDGDGDLDLAVTNYSSNNVSILLNQGTP